MALTVVVRSGAGASAPRITFDAPRIVIGRGEGCEVRLPDPSVSHRHASIRQRGTEYIVLDEGSTNGTFVGSVRLSPQAPRVLQSGDLVRVGRVWLEIVVEQAPPTPNVQLATRELALALVAEALAADGSPAFTRVRVTAGPSAGAELAVGADQRAYVVGRLAAADLLVDDPDLSRRHVELVRRGDRLYVRDLGSKNGSRIGDRTLAPKEEAPWPRGQSLHIGKSELTYEDPLGDALELIESASDEQVREGEVVEPPVGVEDPVAAAAEVRAAARSRTKSRPPPGRRVARASEAAGWTPLDVFVLLLAVVVLALSVAGLAWLMKSG